MRICLVLMLVLICQFAFAQASADKYLYAKISGSIGMFYGGKLSMEYISPKGQTFALALYSQMRKAPGIPSDYSSPLGIFGKALFWSPGFDYPQEIRNTVYVSTGKVIALNSAGKTRLNLSGGIGCSYLKTPVDFVPVDPVVTAENYTYSSSTGYSVALVLNPVVDFAIWKYFGFSTGLISIISRDRVSCGIEISYLLGYVNSRKKNK